MTGSNCDDLWLAFSTDLGIGDSVFITMGYAPKGYPSQGQNGNGYPRPEDFVGPKLVTVNTSWVFGEILPYPGMARSQLGEFQVSAVCTAYPPCVLPIILRCRRQVSWQCGDW